MDTAEGEQRRKPMDTAEVRRVGCKHSLANTQPMQLEAVPVHYPS
jgi:hypothetical protein